MTPKLRNTAKRTRSLRLAGALLAAATAATVSVTAPVPAFAQDSAAEARIRKLEAEIRALQRKVFPGGDGRFFEPEIAPGTQPATATGPAPAPSNSAVTDVLVRLDALEMQLRSLTARSEEQANALSQMEQRLTALETAGNAPIAPTLPVIQPAASAAAPTTPPVTAPAARVPVQTATAPAPARTPAATTTPIAAPSAARLAAVQAIAKPQTADPGDDEYSYGFRLWSAGFFPEARQQLTKFVEQYPNHPRISFGRNLLGRAFLDDKMPEDATRWFLQNYLAKGPNERAPDSLLYLARSMIAQNNTPKACIALAEFAEKYPLIATGRLANEYKASLAQVKCS